MPRTTYPRVVCFRGHRWTPENTIRVKDKSATNGVRRQCRECKNAAHRAWRKINSIEATGQSIQR